MTKLSNAVIPVEDAIVQERQVSVQVLTITKKQVTQTFYRQLIEEDLIDRETGKLRGIPWGWVNLHIDCKDEKGHIHAIWEDNGKLKRAHVGSYYHVGIYSKHYNEIKFDLEKLSGAYIGLLALGKKKINGQEGKDRITLTVKGRTFFIAVPYAVSEFWSLLPPYEEDLKSNLLDIMSLNDGVIIPSGIANSGMNREIAISQIRRELNNFSQKTEYLYSEVMRFVQNELLVAGYPSSTNISYQHAYQLMEDDADELNAMERNWEQSYKKIEDAGQLFVAISGVWK